MDDSTLPPDTVRDRNGRFRKGSSGNPAGRPPGILNEATRTAAMLLGGEAEALTRAAIELALSGNLAALRLCLDRIIAPQREQPAAFTFPESGELGYVPGDVDTAMAALTRAAASGEVTPHAAAALADMLEARARIGEVSARQIVLRHKEILRRDELRICVLLEFHMRYFHAVGVLVDDDLEHRAAELLRVGGDASQWLATIPDSPELIDADAAFIEAHPLPLQREEAHPLVTEMQDALKRLTDWLDWPGRIDDIDRRLAAFLAEHTNIEPDPIDPVEEAARIQLLRDRHLILA